MIEVLAFGDYVEYFVVTLVPHVMKLAACFLLLPQSRPNRQISGPVIFLDEKIKDGQKIVIHKRQRL